MEDLILSFYKNEIILLGDFTLKSGDVSPFYIDLRLIPSIPIIFRTVVKQFSEIISSLPYKPDAIAGIMSAGVPFATGVALELNIPLLQIRKEPKEHGTSKLIEGILPPKNSKVVLIDDLISTGASKIEPADAVRELGLIVDDLVVYLDRSNKAGKKTLSDNGLNLHYVFTIKELLLSLKDVIEDEEDLDKLTDAINSWLN